MRVRTKILCIRSLPPDSPIRYGRTFVTKRKSTIGVIPLGYADGYNRLFSNNGIVLVRGNRVPVVGRVCMDYIMADVTNIPGVSLGDEAVLMGRQGGGQITAEEIAEKIDSIPYEVLCLIGKRVPRVYKE